MSARLLRLILVNVVALLAVVSSVFAEGSKPEDVVDRFAAAWNSHDMEAFQRLFTTDATWTTTYDVMLRGRQNVVEDFRVAHEGFARTTTVSTSKVSVQRLRADVAVVHFNTALQSAGDALAVGRTLLLVVLKQRDGWRIVSGQVTKPNCPPK